MKKLIIIPAYNESENIVKTVESIREKAPGFDYIIVNDTVEQAVERLMQILCANRYNKNHMKEFLDEANQHA